MSFVDLPSLLLAIPRNSITAVGLPLALGVLSGKHTGKVVRSQWYNPYKTLYMPRVRPPNYVFPIVWPLLYISMGYASHLAVKALDTSTAETARAGASLGLSLYYAQLALNVAWSPLFFGMKQVGWALVDSLLLAGTTFYMTKTLDSCTESKSTYLLLPYCAWLCFATYLNGSIWWLNRGRTLNKNM
ncbi:hypothetical protein JAAARDRAFT_28229 [Jaapia argillacea MUCL 33604]|uniref:TspO/MBR-related protein n=1 Tax=Jaapia argillacea MUCL 33604 TaxID=933084 RepID=A0A067QPM1_9AGAM|nr:hypothetical protein JAAARDRAFT_28229 [Jaapia argillacea MUCL 33604]